MPRSPLIIDTPIGRLYAIDLGEGAAMLMIEQDGQAQTLPIDADEAKRLGQYLRPLGKPPGSATSKAEDLQHLVNLYNSEEAAMSDGGKAKYVGDALGITHATIYSRLKRARELGMIADG